LIKEYITLKRTSKKVIHIYCEGDSEKNYFEALKGNKTISNNYVLKPNSKTNDLDIAIRKSQFLEGISGIIVYVFDSDTFKNQKKISDKIKKQKERIYFSEENFEEFLDCHKTKIPYRNKKPNLSRQLIEEIRGLDRSSLKSASKSLRSLRIINQSMTYLESYLNINFKC